MTRLEHLLTKAAEEAAEVVQRATKALRFGISEVQPGQDMSNAQRLVSEFQDLVAVFALLSEECGSEFPAVVDEELVQQKVQKIEAFLRYSQKYCGTLDDPPACAFCGAIAGACADYPNCPNGQKK